MILYFAFRLWLRQRRRTPPPLAVADRAYAVAQYDIDHGLVIHRTLWDGNL